LLKTGLRRLGKGQYVENNGVSADGQTGAKHVEVQQDPPIRKDYDDVEWKVVLPKKRQSYTDMVSE
jgi:hypothetical protein